MHSDIPQRKALKFLREHLHSQAPFTKSELADATGWKKPGTFNTYWSKQLKPFVVYIGGREFRVSEGFRPFMTWKKFHHHVSQNRLVAADYTKHEYEHPVIFEFFMPLTNETALRTTLDALFYKENIEAKLKATGIEELVRHLARLDSEADEAYFQRAASWVADHFGGYSIYHVNGRFRPGSWRRTMKRWSGRDRVIGTWWMKRPRSRGLFFRAPKRTRPSWSATSLKRYLLEVLSS